MPNSSFDFSMGTGLPTERFRDLDLVAAGGQGLLYRAHDELLDRAVAVKVFATDAPGRKVPGSVIAQAQMSSHPNIVSLYDIGRTANGHLYLVMEYVESGSCDQLRRRGPVDVDRTLRIALELAEALQACHDRGIVHCDVKPSNVMLDREGHVRLGDFGSARSVDQATTTLAEIQGSLMFVAPEALEGVRPGKEADVYALALTVRTLLTGEPPWPNAANLAEAIAMRLAARRLSFDSLTERPRLRGALEAATDGDPDNRPLLPELISELRIASGREAPAALAPSPPSPRRRLALVAAAGGILVGALTGYVVRPATDVSTRPAAVTTGSMSSFCGAALSARAELGETVTDMSSTLNVAPARASDPFVAVTMLVDGYPKRFARLSQPMIEEAAKLGALSGDAGVLTPSRLQDLALVDGLYRVSTDATSGLIDSRTLKVSPRDGLPLSLEEAALSYRSLMSAAKTHCDVEQFATSTDHVANSLEEFSTRLKGYLDNTTVNDRFFQADIGRSSQLFTPHQIDLILSSSDFLTDRLATRRDWLTAVLTRDDIRRVVFRNHFPLVIATLNEMPNLEGLMLTHRDWANELWSHWKELPDSERAMFRAGAPNAIDQLDLARKSAN